MGDRLRAGIPPWYVTKPTRLTQPCIPLGSLNRVPALIGWRKGGNVTSAGWQIILCDPMWHVSSRSGEACCELLYPVTLFYSTLCSWWRLLLVRVFPWVLAEILAGKSVSEITKVSLFKTQRITVMRVLQGVWGRRCAASFRFAVQPQCSAFRHGTEQWGWDRRISRSQWDAVAMESWW